MKLISEPTACCEQRVREILQGKCLLGPFLIAAGLGLIYFFAAYFLGWACVLGGAYTGIVGAVQLDKRR